MFGASPVQRLSLLHFVWWKWESEPGVKRKNRRSMGTYLWVERKPSEIYWNLDGDSHAQDA